MKRLALLAAMALGISEGAAPLSYDLPRGYPSVGKIGRVRGKSSHKQNKRRQARK